MAEDATVTFKCSEEFRAWLAREALEMDKSASWVIRQALLLAVPQLRTIRGVGDICLEDIKR